LEGGVENTGSAGQTRGEKETKHHTRRKTCRLQKDEEKFSMRGVNEGKLNQATKSKIMVGRRVESRKHKKEERDELLDRHK